MKEQEQIVSFSRECLRRDYRSAVQAIKRTDAKAIIDPNYVIEIRCQSGHFRMGNLRMIVKWADADSYVHDFSLAL